MAKDPECQVGVSQYADAALLDAPVTPCCQLFQLQLSGETAAPILLSSSSISALLQHRWLHAVALAAQARHHHRYHTDLLARPRPTWDARCKVGRMS